MTTTRYLFLLLCFSFIGVQSIGQPMAPKPLKIAVLAPLYLDSAFNQNTYKLGENNFPKYMLSGVEFYNGVMLAVDSLQKMGANLEVFIYDTKKSGATANSLVKQMSLQNFSLIIASFTNSAEQRIFSSYSFDKNIPLISGTYPNDAYITSNPFFILLNSTLKTHVEAIYNFVEKNYANAKPVFITKKGTQEAKIKADFKTDAGSNKLKYRVAELKDNFTAEQLFANLDSTRKNVLILGSLDHSFAVRLVELISEKKSYNTTVIGMPTWDVLRDFNKPECEGVELIYSTPFNYSRNDDFGKYLTEAYNEKLSGRPSDMVFKGFESMFHFSRLMMQYKNDFINHISDTSFVVANNFFIQPVRLSNESFIPDYLENKALYFVTKMDGKITGVKKMEL